LAGYPAWKTVEIIDRLEKDTGLTVGILGYYRGTND